MTRDPTTHPDWRPWYREPWLLLVFVLLGSVVVASFVTLWLALRHPDYLAVEPEEYDRIRNEMRLDEEAEPADPDQG